MDNDPKSPEMDSPETKPWWSEVMKEITATGLAAVFMTEDTVRGYLKEKKLPKEMVSLLLEGVSKKKDSFYELLTQEFTKMLAKMDLSKELTKFLETHEMSVSAKITFKPKSGENGNG